MTHKEQMREQAKLIIRGTESLLDGIIGSEDEYAITSLALVLRGFAEALAEGRDPLQTGLSLN